MSIMISNMIAAPAHSSAAAKEAKKISSAQAPDEVTRPEDITESRPLTPARDEYIPEEEKEPTGRYWMEKDENGKTTIHFDDPARDEKAADSIRENEAKPAGIPSSAPKTDSQEKADNAGKADDQGKPEKAGSGKDAETCTCSTDKVDREIEKLKKKQAELQKQLNAETDETKIRNLERELAQVESELRQKDNDTYRRQHAQYSFTPS